MLSHRSSEKEILDLGPGHYTSAEFTHCQKILFRINQLLGIFHDTVNLLKKLPGTISVLDVGCGAGLFILNLGLKFPQMKFHGIDISGEAITMAEDEKSRFGAESNNVTFELLTQPVLHYDENSFDVILATLVCHHLSNEELVVFFQQALHAASNQVIINDLHRHAISYWFFRIFSPILFRDRLITNDGLISVKRSFTRKELETLLEKASIHHYQIKWCFPFRWRVVIWKK